jgi:hypothetical protein
MGLQAGSIDHHGILFARLGGQSHHQRCENAFVAPTLPTVVERLVGAILLRRISPSQTIAIDENNPASNPPIIDTSFAMGFRKVGFQPPHLRIVQPEKIRHITAPFSDGESCGSTLINGA